MGRHDSYSYYSEAGGVQGERTPGDKESTQATDAQCCSRCEEKKSSVVERKGNFSGELLCTECVEEKQRVLDRRRHQSHLDNIR